MKRNKLHKKLKKEYLMRDTEENQAGNTSEKRVLVFQNTQGELYNRCDKINEWYISFK
jgi:hypothetical protein